MEDIFIEYNKLERILEGSLEPQDLPLSLVENITDNFSNERIIGEGGFATVYKGVLQNGEVAVKRIRNYYTIEEKLFRKEANILTNINHNNIVRFLGFCSNVTHRRAQNSDQEEYIYIEIRERILCFDYINNGSLDKYITDELRGLEWNARHRIIMEICEGLQYLHEKKHIIHMDLKPANILLDNHMVVKIADFGLSRMDKDTQTKSAHRGMTLRYCAPEYKLSGRMSVKSDVYSLGIIIIELVTGQNGIPDKSKVLRRWRHRWHKSGKETSLEYQQIAKLIEIGIQCQERDPCRRPFISEIIRDLTELENMHMQISNGKESIVRKITPYLDDDMLGIEPLELHFPIELNKQMPCTVELTNGTNNCIAFGIHTMSPLSFHIEPSKGIVQPQSKSIVTITLQPLDNAPQDKKCTSGFIVRSTKVCESLINDDIQEGIFNTVEGKVVDEVTLAVAYVEVVPNVGVSLESVTMSGTSHVNSHEESNVLAQPANTEAMENLCNLDDLIQLEPPQLCFPFLPNKTAAMFCLLRIINITDNFVGYTCWFMLNNRSHYEFEPGMGILPPRSSQVIRVTTREKIEKPQYMRLKDEVGVWNGIVAEGVDVGNISTIWRVEGSKVLPILLTKTDICTLDELIQFEPPQLCFPFLPNKRVPMLGLFKIVNVTDHFIGYNAWVRVNNKASYEFDPATGILPPRSTQLITVKTSKKQEKSPDMRRKDEVGVWNAIVAEGVEIRDISGIWRVEESKVLPIVITKHGDSSCTMM